MINRTQDEWRALVARLQALPRETEEVVGGKGGEK